MRFNVSTDYLGAAWLHAGLLFTVMFLIAPSASQAQVDHARRPASARRLSEHFGNHGAGLDGQG